MKKIFYLLAAALLAGSIVGCDKGSSDETSNFAKKFPDNAFRNYLLKFDKDGNKDLSAAEIKDITYLAFASEVGSEPIPMNLGIKSLAGIEYLTELTSVSLGSEKTETLDLSKATKLTELHASNKSVGNGIKVLKLPESIEKLTFCYNDVTEIDFTKCKNLKKVYCEYNPNLVSFKIDAAPKLEIVEIRGKVNHTTGAWAGLSEISVTGCPVLTTLNVASNKMEILDVRGCSRLSNGEVNGCANLTTIKVSKGMVVNFIGFQASKMKYDISDYTPAQ